MKVLRQGRIRGLIQGNPDLRCVQGGIGRQMHEGFKRWICILSAPRPEHLHVPGPFVSGEILLCPWIHSRNQNLPAGPVMVRVRVFPSSRQSDLTCAGFAPTSCRGVPRGLCHVVCATWSVSRGLCQVVCTVSPPGANSSELRDQAMLLTTGYLAIPKPQAAETLNKIYQYEQALRALTMCQVVKALYPWRSPHDGRSPVFPADPCSTPGSVPWFSGLPDGRFPCSAGVSPVRRGRRLVLLSHTSHCTAPS